MRKPGKGENQIFSAIEQTVVLPIYTPSHNKSYIRVSSVPSVVQSGSLTGSRFILRRLTRRFALPDPPSIWTSTMPWLEEPYLNTLDRLLISRDEITRMETRNPLYLRIPFLESNRIPGRSASPDGPDCLIDLAGCPESPTMVAEYGIRIESGKAWT